MMFEVGKLYICEKYYLLLYPDKNATRTAEKDLEDPARGNLRLADMGASYWSKKLGKPVFYVEKDIPILILSGKTGYMEVLAGDRKGWIIYRDWLELKEINNETIS